MIYITGDTHIPHDISKLNGENFLEGKELTKNDYLIICGDFGGVWYGNKKDDWWLNWLESKPWTTLFVDGNHENFNALNDYPITEWNNGKIHEIRPSVLHLMRGEVFTIEDKTFFCMGGAKSSDKKYRKENVSWWSQEEPNDGELQNGLNNLKKHNNEVDYIITHTCSSNLIKVFDPYPMLANQCNLNHYFNTIAETVKFKEWYFGHFHDDRNLGKYHMLFENIIRIN